MTKYIDAERLKAEIERRRLSNRYIDTEDYENELLEIIDSIQQDVPDKETILRICKLHKAWSIMAPWENVEDFVMTNWNSENIV